jgi:redox-sensitive bicupin YhaK (pirin superfamily)
MSAGTGVRHSEYNADLGVTHFLQIWIEPNSTGIKPSYEQKNFPAHEKRGRLRLIASRDGRECSISLHQEALVYAGPFDGAERAKLKIAAGRLGYVHVARGKITINDHALAAGDGMKTGALTIVLADGQDAEVLIFDLPEQ